MGTPAASPLSHDGVIVGVGIFSHGEILGGAYEAVGNTGLVAAVSGGFVHIKGPCGEGHIMSLDSLKQLHQWIEGKLPRDA